MTETATFAGGCFWCTEAIFQKIKGVIEIKSGYSGGETQNNYKEVSTGLTGHAESIQINFDPSVISFEELLLIFIKTHDPTTLNRQGADVGNQYRSEVFYHNEHQRTSINIVIKKLEDKKIFKNKIITKVSPFKSFYPAEDYHQNYYKKNPNAGYCNFVISPKLKKLEQEFKEKLK